MGEAQSALGSRARQSGQRCARPLQQGDLVCVSFSSCSQDL